MGIGGVLGLGLGFVFCSWDINPPIEVDSEKGSLGIICILEKVRGSYIVKKEEEQKPLTFKGLIFVVVESVQRRKQWF